MHSPTCQDGFHRIVPHSGTINGEIFPDMPAAEARVEYFRQWNPCFGFWIIEDEHEQS